MRQRILIEKIKQAIQEWAAQYPQVELSLVKVNPSGIAHNIHVIVVAAKGFEEWEETERDDNLYWFLRKKLGDEDIVKIPLLSTMTEERYDRYEWAEAA
jgi:hypothetical protein